MWWLGWLEATGRVNPLTYDQDHSLRGLIDVVPTGLPGEPPQHTEPLVRGVVPGIGADDLLLVWGGGIWNWLDPLTLIRAVALVAQTHPHVRLYFPGPRHPNEPYVPDMAMHGAAVELAHALGLWGKHVFVGEWVAYARRQGYLLEADIGCSLHFQNIESLFAFRTRVLDYIWAGLPMVVTRGDAASEMVREHDLGAVVDYEDVEDVARAIRLLAEVPREAYEPRFRRLQEALSWEQAAAPLLAYCQDPRRAPDKELVAQARSEKTEWSQLAAQEEELARLRGLIAGYERGRFIRLMKWAHETWRRLRERGS
jgi:glycosyltransferase involved in cell wall biosynthesis